MSVDLTTPVIVGLTIGIALVLVFAILSPSLSIVYYDEPLTMTGQVACLPHKKFISESLFSIETSECAFGFRSQDGKYYAFQSIFSGEKYNWLFDTHGSEELFNVTGVIRPAADEFEHYEVAGVIDISSAGKADGTISIYEVYARHYTELSSIIEEISHRTGGGYSIAVDVGCDDLGRRIDDSGSSCILIALDKDIPELSDKIPASIEGFEVRVHVF